jgi:hypothetical protein
VQRTRRSSFTPLLLLAMLSAMVIQQQSKLTLIHYSALKIPGYHFLFYKKADEYSYPSGDVHIPAFTY